MSDLAEHPMTAHAATSTAAVETTRVLAVLRREAPRLRALGITRLSLFGSLARGEAGPESDVDLLIEVDPASAFSLFEVVDLQDELSERLGRRIHVAFAGTMRPWLRAEILDEAIQVY